MRGYGSGRKLAKQFYHGGRSEDVLQVLKVLKEERPTSPRLLVGYSLGANIELKLAGELSDQGSNWLTKVIALSPPADLYTGSDSKIGRWQGGSPDFPFGASGLCPRQRLE